MLVRVLSVSEGVLFQQGTFTVLARHIFSISKGELY